MFLSDSTIPLLYKSEFSRVAAYLTSTILFMLDNPLFMLDIVLMNDIPYRVINIPSFFFAFSQDPVQLIMFASWMLKGS